MLALLVLKTPNISETFEKNMSISIYSLPSSFLLRVARPPSFSCVWPVLHPYDTDYTLKRNLAHLSFITFFIALTHMAKEIRKESIWFLTFIERSNAKVDHFRYWYKHRSISLEEPRWWSMMTSDELTNTKWGVHVLQPTKVNGPTNFSSICHF